MTAVEVAVPEHDKIERRMMELEVIGQRLREVPALEARRAELFEELREAGESWAEMGRRAGVTGEAALQAALRARKKREKQ